MTPQANLHILREKFTQLSKSGYFDPAFAEFSEQTVSAIDHVLAEHASYPDQIVRSFHHAVWNVLQFISGSRSSDAPHETQYVLRKALAEWVKSEALISSSALDSFGFHVSLTDMWELIEKSLSNYDTGGYRPLLVRIGSPSAYKHRPIFCIPLFHELGHFVDHTFKISESSVLINAPARPAGLSPKAWNQIVLSHRMEYFADLFAACYVGEAAKHTLMAIAPNNPDSVTHPATTSRVKIIEDFLSGTQNDVVDLLQQTLTLRQQKQLELRFSVPDLGCFDDVLTYRVSSLEELYGVYPAAWTFLHEQIEKRSATWITDDVTDFMIEKTVNDLTEKSIRNFEIVERWNNVTDHKN